jgi:hypothetical protein
MLSHRWFWFGFGKGLQVKSGGFFIYKKAHYKHNGPNL